MKHKFIIITLITALFLTGCNSSNDKEPEPTTPDEPKLIVQETEPAAVTKPVSSTEKPVVTKPAETEEKKSPSAFEANDKSAPILTSGKGSAGSGNSDDYVKGVRIPENVYGPDLNKIGKADITNIKESIDANGERQWWLAECGGFAYLALPMEISSGGADVSADHKEETVYLEFKRCNVGDEIMGFTVKEANSQFSNMRIDESNTEKSRFYAGGTVTLEGKAEMEGYIYIPTDNEAMFMFDGEIFFTPSPESALLPVLETPRAVNSMGVSDIGQSIKSDRGFEYIDWYRPVVLDSAVNGDFDISELPKGEYIKASVIVDGISMRTSGVVDYVIAENAEIKLR